MISTMQPTNFEPDRFEFFFSPLTPTQMCSADDVILHGKLLPFRPPPPQTFVPKPLHNHTRRRFSPAQFTTQHRRPRPWRLLLAFGLVRAPAVAATGMKEIRSRRRCPVLNTGKEAAGWKVLRSLSCRAVESAAVAAAPLDLVPHLRGA